jgi:hypothetical protein
MKSIFSEIEIIKYFESWISNLEEYKEPQDRELLSNYIQEFFQVIESDLSDETKKYLDKKIKDSLKK